MGLFIHLTSRQAIDPAEVAAWSGSDAGKQFVVLSTDHWCAAYIAAGAPTPTQLGPRPIAR